MVRGRFVVAAACLAVVGCGSGGGSNDNGVSFRALGVFQEQEQIAPAVDTFDVKEPQGDTGRIISLSNTDLIPNDVNGDGDLDGGYIGVQNLLSGQRINVQGINGEINIPGAHMQNPVARDFVPLSITLGPAVVAEGEDLSNTSYAQTIFVSADVMAFLNQNRTLLP